MWVLYPGRIGIWRCWFLWREKTGEPGGNDIEKASEQGENHCAIPVPAFRLSECVVS